MRPIDRGSAPKTYNNYQDAKPDLVNRFGSYCSYCERRIATNLAVEHILPKDESLPYAHLRNEWTNFLLGCVNCNSSKRISIIRFDEYLLPDRDNTFYVYVYEETGLIGILPGLAPDLNQMATNTCELVALNNYEHPSWDDKAMYSALERFGQRIQAWVQAKEARADYENGEVNIRRICAEAAATGFFSIWMAAFHGVPEILRALIKAFPNTAANCFDADGNFISPRPSNGLQNSGKS